MIAAIYCRCQTRDKANLREQAQHGAQTAVLGFFIGGNNSSAGIRLAMRDKTKQLAPQARAAHVVVLLFSGREYSTREIAQHIGLQERGTRTLLENLSAVLPLFSDNGKWGMLLDPHDMPY